MKANQIIGALVLSLFTACGSDTPYYGVNPYDPYGTGMAGLSNCVAPQGVKDRTVYANFGNGASLILDIYRRGTQIEAIGELNIPSLPSLLGGTIGVGYAMPQQQLRTTVCTNGSLGSIESGSAYENLELALTGYGVFIEMGSRIGPVPAYMMNEVIEGNVSLQFTGGVNGIPALPPQNLIAVRP